MTVRQQDSVGVIQRTSKLCEEQVRVDVNTGYLCQQSCMRAQHQRPPARCRPPHPQLPFKWVFLMWHLSRLIISNISHFRFPATLVATDFGNQSTRNHSPTAGRGSIHILDRDKAMVWPRSVRHGCPRLGRDQFDECAYSLSEISSPSSCRAVFCSTLVVFQFCVETFTFPCMINFVSFSLLSSAVILLQRHLTLAFCDHFLVKCTRVFPFLVLLSRPLILVFSTVSACE